MALFLAAVATVFTSNQPTFCPVLLLRSVVGSWFPACELIFLSQHFVSFDETGCIVIQDLIHI